MRKHNQDGAINALVLPLSLTGFLLIVALAFGFWAFTERQDYKNNVDTKVAVAVTDAKKEEGISKDKQYAEIAKLPYKTYQGPDQYGSVSFQYPKTWSAYVAGGTAAGEDFQGYFHPDVVPSTTIDTSSFALRVQVQNQTYDSVASQYDGNVEVTVTPFTLAKVPKVIGIKVQGQIEGEKRGVKVILPIRDKTLVLFTDSESFVNDFNNIILPNVSFVP